MNEVMDHVYIHAEAAVLPAGPAVVPVAEVVDARPVADAPVELGPLLGPPAGPPRVIVERVSRERRVERGDPVVGKVVSGRANIMTRSCRDPMGLAEFSAIMTRNRLACRGGRPRARSPGWACRRSRRGTASFREACRGAIPWKM